MLRWATLLLAGCNQVLGLEGTALAPTVASDRDGDTVADDDDNCPDTPNQDQRDEDEDDVGDACDNCPLAANHDQGAVGDADDVGDLCDPHPANDGDCLILFDSFSDPDRFAAGWQTEATLGTTTVEPRTGEVHLAPPMPGSLALYALGSDGTRIEGQHDVQMRARVPDLPVNSDVAVVSNADLSTGLRCSLRPYTNPDGPGVAVFLSMTQTYVRPMSSKPYGDLAHLRMTTEDPDGTIRVQCRVDYGVAIGNAAMTTTALPAATGVGIVVKSVAFDLDAVAIYHFQPGTACPAPVFR